VVTLCLAWEMLSLLSKFALTVHTDSYRYSTGILLCLLACTHSCAALLGSTQCCSVLHTLAKLSVSVCTSCIVVCICYLSAYTVTVHSPNLLTDNMHASLTTTSTTLPTFNTTTAYRQGLWLPTITLYCSAQSTS
jgi:hypothetical protein